jgi:glutaminyl-peptide cyclotransferase
LSALLLVARAYPREATHSAKPKQYGYRVVHVYPHDSAAFTQGLEFRGGYLYEGTGLKGRSTVRKEKLETGEIVNQIHVPPEYFGEGITVINEHVLELTWVGHIGFVYDQASFRSVRTFAYAGEGWGLANDGRTIYMSDGTAQIRCIDPVSLSETRRITVHDGNQPVTELNELECVRGEIYANVWHSWRIARIAPADGSVLGWIDCTGIIASPEIPDPESVLNGIAYDSMGDRLFVTGKLWPKLFEIQLVPKR